MQVDTLGNTEWDVIIAGTGIHQSLLALALSRSDKKVLHLDRNGYYGGAEAALSLQEADEWINDAITQRIHQASIEKSTLANEDDSKLSFSRAYSLALAPQLIYTDSKLIKSLVSSKAYRQLEFQAMGSWWLFNKADRKLTRIPTNREDVAFSDSSIDLRAKRSVMKVLRFVMDYQNQHEIWHPYRDKPFVDFLVQQFKVPATLVDLFLALTMSSHISEQTTTEFALSRISRHLGSIGRLGPGLSSVIPKWGGLSEVAQVGCRAGAVGGAVYVLGNHATSIERADGGIILKLSSGDTVKTKALVGSPLDLNTGDDSTSRSSTSRAIYIVGSSLNTLFPPIAEGAPLPAGSIVIFPAGSLALDSKSPVQLIIHSSETGECPKNQSVIYASAPTSDPQLLDSAVSTLLSTISDFPPPVLWEMHYQHPSMSTAIEAEENIHYFPSHLSSDLIFDDKVLDDVEVVWRAVLGDDATGQEFLVFEDREGQIEDEDEV